jgi:hypothetical protein
MINSCPSKIEPLAFPNSIKDDTNGSQDLFGEFLFLLEFEDLDCCSDVSFLSSQVNTSNTVQLSSRRSIMTVQ